MDQQGRLHPISIAIREISEIFGRMGFGIAYGPELEDENHNFTALNVPEDHPARDMQDTFWIKDRPGYVLRTHTTNTTIRELEKMAKNRETEKRMIIPGKVFRNEATDMTHEAQFYQYDGFAVGPPGTVTLAHLKGTWKRFYQEYFGHDVQIRFRPSYFPFTEPSVEVDLWFEAPGKEGRWLEMFGAGMLHPNVIRNAGLDPEKVQGFAFGPGLERLLMVRYGIPDIRLFHSGDIRFVYGFDEKEDMKISRNWLQNYFEQPLPDTEAINNALTFHAFEIEEADKDMIDVKVLPNRAADCLCHRGIAKELSAILDIPLKNDPLRIPVQNADIVNPYLKIEIKDPEKCLRYIGALIKGVKVGPSPVWLREALESVGQRYINNIVDATNYVMLNIGQPLHAFDAKKARAKK